MLATIVATSALACVGCPSSHENGADAGASDVDSPAAWQTVVEHLDGALLSVWGTGPNDVWAVGGPLGTAPFASLVLHFDGTSWTRLAPGGTATYWWTHGTSKTDVWFVGEEGRITRWDGAKLTEHASGTTATLFGVWAASPTDAWAVGGTPTGTGLDGGVGESDVLLHWDGSAWTPSPLPQKLGRTHFKVWGSSADDVFVVGEAATIWHLNRGMGGAWTLAPQLAHGSLLTVNGCSATEVYAVGGRDVLRYDGKSWAPLAVTLTNDVNGVACGPSGAVVVVGFGGLKQRLVDGVWHDDFGIPPNIDLHGAWSDGAGSFWSSGGDFISKPTPNLRRNGTIARYGKGSVSGVLQ